MDVWHLAHHVWTFVVWPKPSRRISHDQMSTPSLCSFKRYQSQPCCAMSPPYVPPDLRVRYSTPCNQCHIQAFKPLSGSSLQATCGTISMQVLVDKLNHASSASIQRHTGTPKGYFSPPDARFDHVHNDIVGPLPPIKGYTHLLTCVHVFAQGNIIARHFHKINCTSLSWIG